MICKNLRCLIEVPKGRTKFCSKKCGNEHHQKGTVLALSSTVKKGKDCKWCMGSGEGFCCESHKVKYEKVRMAIDSELARKKPEPTERQLKEYKKIENFLNRPL